MAEEKSLVVLDMTTPVRRQPRGMRHDPQIAADRLAQWNEMARAKPVTLPLIIPNSVRDLNPNTVRIKN